MSSVELEGAANQELQYQGLSAFPRFRELPAEIRLQIWREMFPKGTDRRVWMAYHPLGWKACRNIPITALINRESRFETLRIYEALKHYHIIPHRQIPHCLSSHLRYRKVYSWSNHRFYQYGKTHPEWMSFLWNGTQDVLQLYEPYNEKGLHAGYSITRFKSLYRSFWNESKGLIDTVQRLEICVKLNNTQGSLIVALDEFYFLALFEGLAEIILRLYPGSPCPEDLSQYLLRMLRGYFVRKQKNSSSLRIPQITMVGFPQNEPHKRVDELDASDADFKAHWDARH